MKPMFSSWKRISRIAAFLAGVAIAGAVQTGCVAVMAAGAAGTGVAWYSGKLEANLNEDLDTAYRAAQKALAQLEFAKINEAKSGVDAELVSRTALDKKVEVRLQKVTDGTTKVTIRIGVFGDEPLSMTILDKIKSNL